MENLEFLISFFEKSVSGNQYFYTILYTVPEVIDFPRYTMKCSGANEILSGIFHVVSRFALDFMLYRVNLDYFLDSVYSSTVCDLVQQQYFQ